MGKYQDVSQDKPIICFVLWALMDCNLP